MLDYIRSLTKTKEEKQQERLNAYLDDALTLAQRRQVETDLEQSESQRQELEQMGLLRQQMRQLPQRRIKRNFTLDPALYGRPQREPLVTAYPILRTATALAAFFFVIALAANVFLSNTNVFVRSQAPIAMQAVGDEDVIAEAIVEESEDAALMGERIAGTAEAPAEELMEQPVTAEMMGDAAGAPAAAEPAEALDEVLELPTAAEVEEEAQEAPLFADEAAVDLEIEVPTNGAEAASAPLEGGSASGIELERTAPIEEAAVVSPTEEALLGVLPTMTVETLAEADMVAEPEPLPTADITEAAKQSEESLNLEEIGAGDDLRKSGFDVQTQRVHRPIWVNSLGLIMVLLGIGFLILVVLTLFARRRL